MSGSKLVVPRFLMSLGLVSSSLSLTLLVQHLMESSDMMPARPQRKAPPPGLLTSQSWCESVPGYVASSVKRPWLGRGLQLQKPENG